MVKRSALILVAFTYLCLAVISPARAMTIIRDTEIESVLADLAEPVFEVAGLVPGDVNLFLIRSDVLNAFVAGGQNLFIHTGLYTRADDPEELLGVIAHETGHIAGGHLSRTGDALESAAYQSIIGAVLGAAAAIAGAPQLGTALFAGGATVAERNFLAYSRGQEQAADQAAVTYLERLGLPPEGLRDFFGVLENQNLRISSEGDVYRRTHPLTRDRIAFLDNQVETSRFAGERLPADLRARFERSQAKLEAFLGQPAQMVRAFSSDDEVSRYARAIALYRLPDLKAALGLIDGLIAERPDDPFYHELKGQMLFENGRIEDSVDPFREAMKRLPQSALIRLGLGRALMETGDEANLEEAVLILGEASRLEQRNPSVWRFLGIAQGRLGEQGESALSLTEFAVLTRNKRDAELYLSRARQHIDGQDPSFYRLQDLIREVDRMEEPRRAG